MNSGRDRGAWEAVSGRRSFRLFPARTTLGWRVIRMVSLAKGESMIAVGEWRRVLDPISRAHIGYQVCTPEMSRGDYELPTMRSPAAISARESEINAHTNFKDGRSRTEGLSDDERRERRVEEDRVERVRCKVRVWAVVNERSKDILRVWPV